MGLNETFAGGLVFGFDLGTGSLGYAARRGSAWLEVGAIVCSEKGGNLADRRDYRRMRRTLRNRKRRLRRLREELAAIGLPAPQQDPGDPVPLRLKAVRGEALSPEELHAAIFHLLRRRGYDEVPWKSFGDKKKDETGEILGKVSALRSELEAKGLRHPCEWLNQVPPSERRRGRYWNRDLIIAEFDAILEAQRGRCPRLAEARDAILFGECHWTERNERRFPVYFTSRAAATAGIMALRWPRFDNRSPGLDAWSPIDEEGRALHVARANKKEYKRFQFEAAILNFRVVDRNNRSFLNEPPASLIALIRARWNAPATKGRKKATGEAGMRVPLPDLKTIVADWNQAHPGKEIDLVEGQTDLTPVSEDGRARYSTKTLKAIHDTLEGGHRVDPPQPVLRRRGETVEEALNRLIAETPNPLVRDRLAKLRDLLDRLIERHGKPDLVVVEAIRELGLGTEKKKALIKRRDARAEARAEARNDGASSRKEMRLYLLHKELDGVCPYCRAAGIPADFTRSDFQLEHIVPYRRSFCSETFNLTVACPDCNRAKGDRTPYEAWHGTERWPTIVASADNFRAKGQRLKADLLLSPVAEEKVESRRSLAGTSYIAREARGLVLTRLGWTTLEGRDPTGTPGFFAYQTTNGAITAELRRFWGLNAALHHDEPNPERRLTKNRSDMRHHALDAMVIAATLPWAAARGSDKGGWRGFGGEGREEIENPLGLTLKTALEWMERATIATRDPVGHHAKHYDTTLLGRREVADETWFVARDRLGGLKPKNLAKVYPTELGRYIGLAWERFEQEGGRPGKKDVLPEEFIRRLCFSHYQRWRTSGMSAFAWPEAVRIPIRSVRYMQAKDPDAVMPLRRNQRQKAPDNGPFVKRKEVREVWLMLKPDGSLDRIVRVPHYRHDPLAPREKRPENAIILRKGDVVRLKKVPNAKAPAGEWRITVMGEDQIKLIPSRLVKSFRSKDDKRAAFAAWGVSENGWSPMWKTFIDHLDLDAKPST